MTSSMDGESLPGQAVKYMKGSSETISDMVQEPTNTQVERWESSCGLMVKSTTGFIVNRRRSIDAEI